MARPAPILATAKTDGATAAGVVASTGPWRAPDRASRRVHLLVTDLYDTFGALIEAKKIVSLAEVYACTTPLVAFSTDYVTITYDSQPPDARVDAAHLKQAACLLRLNNMAWTQETVFDTEVFAWAAGEEPHPVLELRRWQ